MLKNPKFKILAEASSAVTNNVEANLAINTLARLQNSSIRLQENLVLRPEMIPMIPMEINGKTYVTIEGGMVALSAKRSNLTEEAVLEEAFNSLVEQGITVNESELTKDQIAVIVAEQDIESLYSNVLAEATHINERVNEVNQFIESINTVKAAGYTVVFNK